MRIIQLQAENVKRLQAIEITPDGAVVQITGKNGQGKSSVLDAIAYALGGKEAACERPVRNGQKKAKIVCKLDDLVVTRTFTPEGGGTLTVANADGARYPSPQAVLDKLVGKLTLDPLAFSRMAPKQQAETLKGLVGLDFTAMDAERAQRYAERTTVNKSAAAAKQKADSLPTHDDAPEEEISVADLIGERDRRAAANSQRQQRQQKLEHLQHTAASQAAVCQSSADRQADIETAHAGQLQRIDQEMEAELERVRAAAERRRIEVAAQRDQQLAREKIACAAAVKARADAEAALATLAAEAEMPAADVDEITTQIAAADITNRKIRENQRWAEAEAAAGSLQERADALTARLEEIDGTKRESLATAKFPVAGLSFDETGVTYNGVPFAQASSAEQLRVSVAIGLAMNPKLRVLLIRDGSLLDAEGMAMLQALAEDHDAQVWIERVEDAGNVGVVISDGCVASPAQAHADPQEVA